MAVLQINKQDGAPEIRRRANLLYVLLAIVFFGLIARLVHLQLSTANATRFCPRITVCGSSAFPARAA